MLFDLTENKEFCNLIKYYNEEVEKIKIIKTSRKIAKINGMKPEQKIIKVNEHHHLLEIQEKKIERHEDRMP